MAHLGLILGICAILAALSGPSEACFDVSQRYCTAWKNMGYCRLARVKQMCKKSCGLCDACSDTLPSYCTNWGSRGLCILQRVKDMCKKTCGVCSGTGSTPIPTQPACFDSAARYCPRWRNLCASETVKRLCRKTCGLCGSVVTTAPVPDTAPPPLPGTTPINPGVVTDTLQPPAPGSCGRPEVAQSRVIDGVDAKKGAWPWQILMLFNGRTMCGGSLISPNWVVTAAHCVSGRENSASQFTVRVGEHETGTTSDGQHTDIKVEKIISHPSYSRSTINNDIALMKLDTPVQFGKYVKPVCLPSKPVPVGTQCFITGWGKIKHPGSMHHTLQQGKMPVVSKSDCTNMNTKNFRIAITDQMVCAGHGGSTRVSGCHGDSGGPFVCQTGANGSWELHGAVSWGSGRCDATQGYTVFARVEKFLSWINQITNS